MARDTTCWRTLVELVKSRPGTYSIVIKIRARISNDGLLFSKEETKNNYIEVFKLRM